MYIHLVRFRHVSLYIFPLLMALQAGCVMRLNRSYGYLTVPPPKVNFGEIGVRLLGTFQSNEHETLRGSPYQLLVWLRPEHSLSSSNYAITKLHLRQTNQEEVSFSIPAPIKGRIKRDSDGLQTVYFTINDINVEYQDYILELTVVGDADGRFIQHRISVELKRDYKESRSSDFWDRIMSI